MAQTKQRIGNEISLLANEVSDRYSQVYESQKGSKRFLFLAAQASLCAYFMKVTAARNDDWGWFPELLKAHREEALARYQEAREEQDLDQALPMLARLRLMTTLDRRLSDHRRGKLFIGEPESPDTMAEENLWVTEVRLMTEEAMANHQRVESHGNPVRSRMALAQFCLGHIILKQVVELDDWSGLKDSVYDYIDSETERYRQARAAEDRAEASVMLARVRFARHLARRFDDPERQAWLARLQRESPTTH